VVEQVRKSSFDIGADEKDNSSFVLAQNRELSPIRGAPGSTGAASEKFASEKDPEESKVGCGIEFIEPNEISPPTLVIEAPKKKKKHREVEVLSIIGEGSQGVVALCKKKYQVRSESPTSLENYRGDFMDESLKGLNELNIGKNSVQKD
jgi:hypothetical protein